MRQFAERIRARVIEMAIREVDVNVRLEVITGMVAAFDR